MLRAATPAATWTSDAGAGLGMSQSVPTRLSLVAEMFSWFLIGSGVGLALEMFYKANWCSLSLHQMLGTTQTSFPADILRTSSQFSQSETCVKLCWPIRFEILSMVVEIWDMERFMRTDLPTVSHGGLQFLHSSPFYHWSRSQSGIIWSCLDIL